MQNTGGLQRLAPWMVMSLIMYLKITTHAAIYQPDVMQFVNVTDLARDAS